MYVPATPAPTAPALTPAGIVSSAPPLQLRPAQALLKVRSSSLNVLEGRRASVTGVLLEDRHAAKRGLLVALQVLGRHGWRSVAHTRTRAHGRFRVSYTPRTLGSELTRLRFAGDASATGTRKRLARLNVFRLAGASWYGGGGTMACGGALTSSTLGVANKTLPCGTLVTLRYGGHTVRVPVIDRGPYVAGRDFDLTEATKRALGFGDTGDVWSTS
jgi:peptidoglycan lytic transglycosylase